MDDRTMWKRIKSAADEPKVLADALDVEGLTEDGSPVVYIDGRRFNSLLNRWTFSEELTRIEAAELMGPAEGRHSGGSGERP